jgi:hypothetical protein
MSPSSFQPDPWNDWPVAPGVGTAGGGGGGGGCCEAVAGHPDCPDHACAPMSGVGWLWTGRCCGTDGYPPPAIAATGE